MITVHFHAFRRYVSVLVELAQLEGVRNGELLAEQLMEVAIRVPTVRSFCVDQMDLLLSGVFKAVTDTSATGDTASNRVPVVPDVIYAAAWICAEYSR